MGSWRATVGMTVMRMPRTAGRSAAADHGASGAAGRTGADLGDAPGTDSPVADPAAEAPASGPAAAGTGQGGWRARAPQRPGRRGWEARRHGPGGRLSAAGR